MAFAIYSLEEILLKSWKTKEEKNQMKIIREKLVDFAYSKNNQDLIKSIEKLVYRPVVSLYSNPRIKSFSCRETRFFGKNIGTFKPGTKKLALSKENRTFKLRFLPSGDIIDAYINQDSGKAIQSIDKQDILGNWILRGVFQLAEREILTAQRLDELEINGIRISKFRNNEIGIEFIWIDIDNPPSDAIGWVAKNK